MANKNTETLVGAFVLLGLAGLTFLALKSANLASFSSGQTYKVTAKFENIIAVRMKSIPSTASDETTTVRVVA